MNVSGIRPLSGFYSSNSISQVNAAPQAESTALAEEAVPAAPAEEEDHSAAIAAAKERQTFGAYDYAKQYNPDSIYDMKGSESDLHSLDVDKAISDMQRDEVLHRYQYFVGEKITANADTAAASAIRGNEDFSL